MITRAQAQERFARLQQERVHGARLVFDAAALDEARACIDAWNSMEPVSFLRLPVAGIKSTDEPETLALVVRCAEVLVDGDPRPATHAEYRDRAMRACQSRFREIAQFEAAHQWALRAVLCGWSLTIEAGPPADRVSIAQAVDAAPTR